jgi:hypothetical protein
LKRYRIRTALGVVLIVVVSSGAALSQAGYYQPSSALYALEQVQEGVMLRLPMPAAQKASVQMRAAENRTRKLEGTHKDEPYQTRLEAMRDSNAFLNRAVDQISAAKQLQSERGKAQQEQKYVEMLERLEQIAGKHEQVATDMINSESTDLEQEQEIEAHLKTIKNIRYRVQTTIQK